MTCRLLLVESPAKQKRIAALLGAGWRVEATRGHVRDLPQDRLGIEVDNDFRPLYEVLPRQANTVKRLLKAIREAEAVYVATDLDREGEAIAWHMLQLANLPPDKPVYRVAFTAITESAVKAAIAAPRPLDVSLVEAQQTRRIIDRLVGYLASPLACQALERPLHLPAERRGQERPGHRSGAGRGTGGRSGAGQPLADDGQGVAGETEGG